MKKICLFFAVCFIVMIYSFPVAASSTEKTIDEYLEKAQQYTDNKYFLSDGFDGLWNGIRNFYDDELELDLKDFIRTFILVIVVNLVSSVLSSFVSNGEIADVAKFCCYSISAVFIITLFRNTALECTQGIKDLSDFMLLSFPAMTGLLAGGGYVSTASSMQIVFNLVSVFLTKFINDIVMPVLYSCGLLCMIDGITTVVNISQIIASVKKTVKYIIGMLLTVFAGILAFAGFSGITTDNLAMRTAKYAVANFVPVVGACLSEALSSMLHSSSILKNNIGTIGFSAIVAICFYPVVKTSVCVLAFKFMSSVLILMSSESIAKVVETVSDILEMMMGIFLIITVMFVLILTIIISTGTMGI